MIFWIITAIITFFLFRWIVTVPCLIEVNGTYEPIGMKLWILLLIIVLALTPILNLILDIAAIVALIAYRYLEEMEWNEMFPNGPGKVMSFLNKKL